MVNFSATYTDKMPDLYFISTCPKSEMNRRLHSDYDYCEIGGKFAKFIQWEPHNDCIFKINLQKVYQTLRYKYPFITLDVCLSWYTRWGQIIISRDSYAEIEPLSSVELAEPINQLQLDYDVVVLDATPDFVENEYWTLSNSQLNDLHNLANNESTDALNLSLQVMLPVANDSEMQSYFSALKKFMANPLKSIAFVDKHGHYFMAMPVMDCYALEMPALDAKVNMLAEKCSIAPLRNFNELNRVEVTVAEMKHILNQVDLLKYQDYWAVSAVYNQSDPFLKLEQQDNILFTNSLAIFDAQTNRNLPKLVSFIKDMFQWPRDQKNNQSNAKQVCLGACEQRVQRAYIGIINYLNQNLQTYYDDQGRVTFKLPFENAVWQEHIDAFTKTNPFQNKDHTVIESMADAMYMHGVFESYEKATNNAAPVSNTVLAVILNQLSLSDNGIMADLQQADAAKMKVTPLKITHDSQTPIKPLVSSSGVNRILVSLAENDQHCFSVQQKQLIDLQYMVRNWSGRKLNYEKFT